MYRVECRISNKNFQKIYRPKIRLYRLNGQDQSLGGVSHPPHPLHGTGPGYVILNSGNVALNRKKRTISYVFRRGSYVEILEFAIYFSAVN